MLKRDKIVKHLVGYSILCSGLIGIVIGVANYPDANPSALLGYLLIGILLVYPAVLTLLNLFFLFARSDDPQLVRKGRHIEYITIMLGSLYSVMITPLLNIRRDDWDEVLVNSQVHTPVWSGAWITVLVLVGVAVAGYILLSCINVNEVPPLVTVCAMAAMYLGILLCILWIVQIFKKDFLILCLFPFNCIILAAKMVRLKVLEWKAGQEVEVKQFKKKYLEVLNRRLLKAKRWPVAAFILMWPLLGIIILILILFGQQPDSIIRGWTETSDWNLSNRVSPPSVYYDEHYLCTVAAGGHDKIVKPIRIGERHGHRVIVNRQLCIANAFEQVLEERTPVFHRHLRRFYDRYGFPVAKMIHSPYAADVIYILMKPLECFFLTVLYFNDVNPENRIAVQYLPRKGK